MKWTLVMMVLGTTPVQTGLVYDTLGACYAADDKVAAAYVADYNSWIAWAKEHPKDSTYPNIPDFITNRISRGVCIPHPDMVRSP